MDRQEFEQQISALRRGELQLEEEGPNRLSRFASGTIYELRQYISGLEEGYRKLWGLLEHNTGKIKAGETTLRDMIHNQWSNEAALGYAWMAAVQIALPPDKTVMLLEAMGDKMEKHDRAYAEEMHRRLIDGGGSAHGG